MCGREAKTKTLIPEFSRTVGDLSASVRPVSPTLMLTSGSSSSNWKPEWGRNFARETSHKFTNFTARKWGPSTKWKPEITTSCSTLTRWTSCWPSSPARAARRWPSPSETGRGSVSRTASTRAEQTIKTWRDRSTMENWSTNWNFSIKTEGSDKNGLNGFTINSEPCNFGLQNLWKLQSSLKLTEKVCFRFKFQSFYKNWGRKNYLTGSSVYPGVEEVVFSDLPVLYDIQCTMIISWNSWFIKRVDSLERAGVWSVADVKQKRLLSSDGLAGWSCSVNYLNFSPEIKLQRQTLQ